MPDRNNRNQTDRSDQAPQLQSTTGRPLPNNIEAEKSVLAACMLNPDAVDEIATKLVPENFFRPAHQLIYAGILELNTRHIPIDQISLADRLAAEGQLEAVGGRPYLVELANNTLALTNWKNHTEIVKRNSVLRDLVYASTNINALAYDAPDDTNEVIEDAEKMLFEVTQKRVSSSFQNITDLLTQAFGEIDELVNNKNQMAGTPTGFTDVDKLFWGLRGGDLLILAARPGVGKTSFALNVATNAAKAGAAVALFSLEMGANQLVQRILCAEARVNLGQLRAGNLQEGDWNAIMNAAATLSGLELYIDDTPGLSLLEMRAKARRQLRDKKKGLIIVDYLQLMQSAGSGHGWSNESRTQAVSDMSRMLKIMAKELNVPVICLSQLSRANESRQNKRPMLSDLRESGAIEQDADIVLALYRDGYYNKECENPNLAEAIILKNRHGETGTLELMWLPEYTSFAAIEKKYEDDDY